MKRKKGFDFWVIASFAILALYLLFMVYPLFKIMGKSVIDPKTGTFTLNNFIKFFSQPYYSSTLLNSFKVAICAAVVSLLIGVPLAYFYNMYRIRGKRTLQMLIILSSMSAPFIGVMFSIHWMLFSCPSL